MLDDVDFEADESDSVEEQSGLAQLRSGASTLSSAAILVGALALLFWNETYSKRHADGLLEAAAQVQPAGTMINAALDGKPVHLTAKVHSNAGASDAVFGVRTDGIALYRHVEMFQWIEYQDSKGRGAQKKTTYYYEQDWHWEYQDSSQFHEPKGHENPKPALESDGFFAADARFGPYRFDNKEVAEQALRDADYPDAPGSLGKWPVIIENLPELSTELTAKRWYTLEAGVYYRGNQNAEEPDLGDLHVSFYALANDFQLTLLAAQQGEQLQSWRASNGDPIFLAAAGTQSAKQLVKIAQGDNASRTHFFRIVGLIAAVIGGAGTALWLGGFLTTIPVVGSLVSLSLRVAGGLFGLLAGLVTVVVGWLSARPWIAGLLMALIVGAIIFAIRKSRLAEGLARRAKRASALANKAKKLAAQALANARPNPGLAMANAGPGAPPPPPPANRPSGSLAPTKRIPTVPAPPNAPLVDPKELPPLEWTPGLIAVKPPAVRPPTPPAKPENSVAPPAAKPPARPEPPRGATPAVPARAPAAPLFDTVPSREATPALFDSVPMREAPLFDSVPMREAAPFDSVPTRASKPPVIDEFNFTIPTAPEPPKTRRIALGSKGDYALSKIVREHADGKQELICFELSKAGTPIKRGSQEEVKEALRQALAG